MMLVQLVVVALILFQVSEGDAKICRGAIEEKAFGCRDCTYNVDVGWWNLEMMCT